MQLPRVALSRLGENRLHRPALHDIYGNLGGFYHNVKKGQGGFKCKGCVRVSVQTFMDFLVDWVVLFIRVVWKLPYIVIPAQAGIHKNRGYGLRRNDKGESRAKRNTL